MTKIKMCGLTRKEDIETVNRLKPDFIGFVFARKSKRYVTADKAKELKGLLDPGIKAVGVFVNEDPETVAGLLKTDVIDMAQLHGNEDEEYIGMLRRLSGKPIIKAFQIKNVTALDEIENSSADWVLIDSGAGTGSTFDWKMIKDVKRPYFLAGGLTPDNAARAVRELHPYALDVSSGIETGGVKDPEKMKQFMEVRS